MSDAPRILTKTPELFRKLRESPIDPVQYISQGEALLLQTRGNAGTTVTIAARLLMPDGTVQYTLDNLVTSSDRSLVTLAIPMQECILLSVIVDVGNAEVPRGAVYASVHVRRAPAAVAPGFQFLVQGYVDGCTRLTYPYGFSEPSVSGYGQARSITGTDPAAGVEITEAVPTNAIWLLKSVTAILVTDVTVANRQVDLIIDDGANILARLAPVALQTASQSIRYTWSAAQGNAVGTTQVVSIGAAAPLLLRQAFRVRTSTANLQVGDNWGAAQLLVEEFIVEA